jgi:hypothetical protein
LDRLANLDKQFEALASGQAILIAIMGDPHASNQFHHEKRPAYLSCSGITNASDIRMIHHRQRLPFGVKARHDILGIHPQLNDFQSHAPSDWLLLLGHVHDAATAFTQFLQEFIPSDASAGFFGCRYRMHRFFQCRGSFSEKTARSRIRGEE